MDDMAKTLLTLWLSLQTTEVRLSAGEESALETIAQQLHQHWDAWQSLHKDLIGLIQENPSLHRVFHEIKPELDNIDNEELLELLPSETELSQQKLASGVVGMFDVSTANNTVTHSGVLEQLLLQLRNQIRREMADPQLVTAGDFQKRTEPEQVDDEAFALACALVDEYELGWDSEWQQVAVTDWEASGL
jgi:hypothetical protein